MTLTIIGIGGTGARCAEAIAHLGATGAFESKLRFLLIDLDQGNGNLDRTRQVIERYNRVRSHAPDDDLYAVPMELEVWDAPQSRMTFGEALQQSTLSRRGEQFLRLFFPESYDSLDLSVGCHQHPEIGALILRRLLRQSLAEDSGSVRRTLDAIAGDFQSGDPTPVFVVGSVFGGTGASGLPFIPAFFDSQELTGHRSEFETRKGQLKLGAALVAPYFQWQGGGGGDADPGPQVDRLASHARSVLQHYARHFPAYERVYVGGAPELHVTCDYAVDGGNDQIHKAHYVEWLVALAALDFFHTSSLSSKRCAFAESTVTSGRGGGRRQLAINWSTLPVDDRWKKKVRSRFLEFSILAGLLRGHLVPHLSNGRFASYPWYEDGVQRALPEAQKKILGNACDEYLRWLSEVLDSIPASDHPSLLALDADQLATVYPAAAVAEDHADVLPSLLMTGKSSEYHFAQILEEMDHVSPAGLIASEARRSPLGRLLFFAVPAVRAVVKRAAKQIESVPSGTVQRRSDAQSRYLPKLDWEPDVFAQPGEFVSDGPGLLKRIGDGLVVGNDSAGRRNPISSAWAHAHLFETKLRGGVTDRASAVAQWRGLLGLVAFRLPLGDGNAVKSERLDLVELAATEQNAEALGEFVREARSADLEPWLNLHILELRGSPIAGTSPFTFLFPAVEINQTIQGAAHVVPWFDEAAGTLMDPAEYFDLHADDSEAAVRYQALLRAWLEEVLHTFDAISDRMGLREPNFVRTELQQWLESPALQDVVAADRQGLIRRAFLGVPTMPAIASDWRNF